MSAKKKSYYGPFFWLSLAAFIAPVFVGVQAFQAAPKPYTQPAPRPDSAGVDHGLWDYLLKTYVENGLIDYDGFKRNHLFKDYVRQLGAAKPEALATNNERLALYCNAYNALVIDGVIRHDISDSVMNYKQGLTGFFGIKEHILAGETLSLDKIEHKLIRPVFKEPRIHMALVCAAKSCPAIRAEAYTGKDVRKQLDDQARLFANNPQHVSYDEASGKILLSAILNWYGDDFDVEGGYLAFLAERVEDPKLQATLKRADAGDIKVKFNDYDWALNTQGTAKKTGGGATGEFGSGSVPNE